MPPNISLVVHADSYDPALVKLVRSVDAQSLNYRDFEVIFVVPATAATVRRRLERLARCRPNVTIQPFDGDWSDALVTAGARVAASFLLPLTPQLYGAGARLHPQALERLSNFLQDHDCDLVVARTSWPVREKPIPAFFRSDLDRAEPHLITALFEDSTLGYRTEFVRANGLALDALSAQQVSAATDRVGVLGSYPILAHPDQSAASPAVALGDTGDVSLTSQSASWREGQICLAAEVQADGPIMVQLSILNTASGMEYWLPAVGPGIWQLDSRSAALGSPLPDGRWTVMINAYADGNKPVFRSSFPATALPTGLVDGTLMVPREDDGAFVLDVAATMTSPVPKLERDQVEITEDAGGALLTARLPDFHAVGRSVIDGAVILDRLKLPARLCADDQGARLECFVSGLPGERTLATQFGASPPTPTGISLVISTLGELSLIDTPDQPPEPPDNRSRPASKGSISARGTPSSAKPKRESLVRRMRHSVPPLLEPVAKRLSRNEFAKSLYRKLAGY